VPFAVDADAYDRFMGRYSVRLAPSFADFAKSYWVIVRLMSAVAQVRWQQSSYDVWERQPLRRPIRRSNLPMPSGSAFPELTYASRPRKSCRLPTASSTRRWPSSSFTS
jgi:hypothetical protein